MFSAYMVQFAHMFEILGMIVRCYSS